MSLYALKLYFRTTKLDPILCENYQQEIFVSVFASPFDKFCLNFVISWVTVA